MMTKILNVLDTHRVKREPLAHVVETEVDEIEAEGLIGCEAQGEVAAYAAKASRQPWSVTYDEEWDQVLAHQNFLTKCTIAQTTAT